MTSKPSIADFTAALDATRAELADVNAAIEGLEQDRIRIANAPPHADDIAAAFQRGLSNGIADFERQFSDRLQEKFSASDGKAAEAAAPGRAINILQIDGRALSSDELVTRAQRGGATDLNAAAVTFFLRDMIAPAIPELISRLFPSAHDGMTQTARAQAFTTIDAELTELRTKRDRLQADLNAARTAVRGGAA